MERLGVWNGDLSGSEISNFGLKFGQISLFLLNFSKCRPKFTRIIRTKNLRTFRLRAICANRLQLPIRIAIRNRFTEKKKVPQPSQRPIRSEGVQCKGGRLESPLRILMSILVQLSGSRLKLRSLALVVVSRSSGLRVSRGCRTAASGTPCVRCGHSTMRGNGGSSVRPINLSPGGPTPGAGTIPLPSCRAILLALLLLAPPLLLLRRCGVFGLLLRLGCGPEFSRIWEVQSSYWYWLEGIFSEFISLPGPHDFLGKINRSIRTGDFSPNGFLGGPVIGTRMSLP